MQVSVIVPAWGETPYLRRALESLEAQTFKDVEIVVASPPLDGPQTLPAARLAGLSKAKGRWIAFCDADDWMEPWAIERMLAAAEECGADCVCSGVLRDAVDGTATLRKYDPAGPSDTFNSLCGKLFKRALLEGLKIDYTITRGEDLMATAQALRKAKKIAVLETPFYHYCENTASVTHRQDGRKRVEDLAKVGKILREAMPEKEYDAFHDRVTRDALLLWIRFLLLDRRLWRELRSRMKSGLLDDPRHGIIKKGALAFASCIFD